MITDVDGVYSDVTYRIKKDKNVKSKAKLNYFSAIPVEQGFVPPSNVHVIHYGQPRPVVVQQVGGVSQTTTTTTTIAPTTTTTWRSDWPVCAKPNEIPSPQERAVEACEFSITSCSLSLRFG